MASERGFNRAITRAAFLATLQRITLLAVGVDATFLVFFWFIDSPLLAWLNVVSIGMYLTAYRLLSLRRNYSALALIWIEVVSHALVGTLLLGWSAGFNYYLLMFIPAIMVSGGWRSVTFFLAFLFIAYQALHAMSWYYGALQPIGDTALAVLNVFNVSIFFAMASSLARFYYIRVRKAEARLQELAIRDALTGLFNRRHTTAVAAQAIARSRRSGTTLSVLLVDIDRFKRINDDLGHEAGDRVLVELGRLFKRSCREGDIAGRWGGEEFLFVLPDTAGGAANELAERLREQVRQARLGHPKTPVACTISVGVAELSAKESLSTGVARADRALYRSKDDGRDRVNVAGHGSRRDGRPDKSAPSAVTLADDASFSGLVWRQFSPPAADIPYR